MYGQQHIKNGLPLFFDGRYGSTLTHCFSSFFSCFLLSQCKRFACTTVTILNVHVPQFTANINAYIQASGLPGWFTGWQVSGIQTCQPGKQQHWGYLTFHSAACLIQCERWLRCVCGYIWKMKQYFDIQFINVFLYISTHLKQCI